MNERAAEHVILLNIFCCGQIRTSASPSGQANEKEARILRLNCHGNLLGQGANGCLRCVGYHHIGNTPYTGLHIVDWWRRIPRRISVFAVVVFRKEAVGLVHLAASPKAFLFRVKCRLMNLLEGTFGFMRHV